MANLAERLKELRKSKQKRQEDIADFLNINRVTYHGYEAGKHEPNLDTLTRLAEFYNTSIDYLIGRY